jgi:group I intron endonuclease
MIVYGFINLVNGKTYIGITVHSIDVRWRQHLASARWGSEYHFHRAIRKHGDEQFVGVVLEECLTVDEMKNAEKRWIKLLATNIQSHGYNMTLGGDGINGLKMSDDTKRHLHEVHLGKKHSEETKRKMSETHKARYADPLNRKKTSDALMKEEVRRKMSENGKGKGCNRVLSQETKQKISDGHKRRRMYKEMMQSKI